MVHRPEGPTERMDRTVNLKELTDVKELVEICCEKLGFVVEVLEDELRDVPTGDDAGSESPEEEVGVDEPVDPLEDARVAAIQAYDILASILDVTEPHRKRYEAQRSARDGGVGGSGGAKLPRRQTGIRDAVLTTDKRQLVIPGAGNSAGNTEEVPDGTRAAKKRLTYGPAKRTRT